jgi:hypothetical protein
MNFDEALRKGQRGMEELRSAAEGEEGGEASALDEP